MNDKPSGLLSRWNLRRQQVADEQEAEEKALEVVEQAEASTQETSLEDASTDASAEPQAENQILSAEDLPDPEKIEVGGSFAGFMADNVDPTAKAAALKALWRQPQYNEIDGLLEYALDYTNQPKLTPEHSAEIAKKIFRYVTKDKEEEQEGEETLTAKLDTPVEEIATHSGEEVSGDILDVESDDLTQNEPQTQDDSKVTVS